MRLLKMLTTFRSRDDGVISTEAAMIMPILLFAYLGLFTFFDAFRTQNINVRASYTISDMLSRENGCIDDAYISGLNDILSILTQSQYPTILRVTIVENDPDEEDLQLKWSEVDGGTGGIQELTQGTLSEIEDEIPAIADYDLGIVVETWAGFDPVLNFGIDAQYFENLVVTRPRFAGQLRWDPGNDPVCNA
ncbi:MAG: hypothetical protein QNJ16_17325 [Rhodobacter sp.]|nr:hypothetical protein [Rhodobacter sp.]